jgi:hypothetical protein
MQQMLPGQAYPAAHVLAPRVHLHFARHLNDARVRSGELLASLPDVDAIGAVIETAFWASLRREEGYVPRISLAFVAPDQAAQPLRFGHPLPLEAAALTRVAPAVAPAAFTSAWARRQRPVGVGSRARLPRLCFSPRWPRRLLVVNTRSGVLGVQNVASSRRPDQGHRRTGVHVARLPAAAHPARLRRAQLVD